MEFAQYFRKATQNEPYPYQQRLAHSPTLPTLLSVPTGMGKTDAVVLAWLWRRLEHPDPDTRKATPRRLVYCLPMRVLVEQTRERIQVWLERLGLKDQVYLSTLMGGEVDRDWRTAPEQMGILVGTQDMLLSRALNRGYGMSQFQWPVEFGLLNNDCLWVMDEVQLMTNGLPTSTQLAAFRQSLGTYGPQHTIWMSATVRPKWLCTVDFPAPPEDQVFKLSQEDMYTPALERRHTAVKELHRLVDIEGKGGGQPYSLREGAARVKALHRQGTMTVVVVNTVQRAQLLFDELRKLKPDAELLLVHSRFRPAERRGLNTRLKEPVPPEGPGRIVVATQAIEAGVDISARALVTELAPWASLVQRFGRCNRAGEFSRADIYWLDLPDLKKHAAPYEEQELERARELLKGMESHSAAPASLPEVGDEITHNVVLRRRDLIGLFDTMPDLSGNYLDVSRFVRGTDENEVQVFWRQWPKGTPPQFREPPTMVELCSVPIGEVQTYLKERSAWHWDILDGEWQEVRAGEVRAGEVRPGQILLLRSEDGGYTSTLGWHSDSKETVIPVPFPQQAKSEDSLEGDPNSTEQKSWITLARHSLDAAQEAERILGRLDGIGLGNQERQAVLMAARWHDAGKAHQVFQDTMLSNLSEAEKSARQGQVWAKRGSPGRPRHSRRHFRHELASALALLQHAPPGLGGWARDLAAYLAAAHHGKVRVGLRSLPGKGGRNPEYGQLLGFSLEGGDKLPITDLGDGLKVPETAIDLSIAAVGMDQNGQRSWLERTLSLRDRLGPFRLAFLEALVRAADAIASRNEQQ